MLQSRLLLLGQRLIEKGAWFFAPISWVWGFVSWIRNRLYNVKRLYIAHINAVVVSVGNIVAGGTGKTPLVLLLAMSLRGKRVAVLSRGVGEMPDEPLLLQRRGIKVYVGKNRILSGMRAVQEGAEILILDDGFQHRRLHRDFDLVILDGSDPFGKGHFLPWGFLRESPKGLSRADAIFVQGKCAPFADAIEVELRVGRILDLKEREVESIKGEKVGIFSGIAKPKKFRKTVESLGAEVVEEWILADHEVPKEADLKAFAAKCPGWVICTEKDFVKLPKTLALPILFLEMRMDVLSGKEKWEKLIEKIGLKSDN